jgi:hypothetical protein
MDIYSHLAMFYYLKVNNRKKLPMNCIEILKLPLYYVRSYQYSYSNRLRAAHWLFDALSDENPAFVQRFSTSINSSFLKPIW